MPEGKHKGTHGGKRPGSGRRKGTPNRVVTKTREDLWAYIDQKCAAGQKANPFEVLVDEMYTTDDRRLAVQCAAELADRLLPKLKATEHSGEVTTHVITHKFGKAKRASH